MYTNNDTYAKKATESFEWMQSINFIDKDWNVYDGGHVETQCKKLNKDQYSYNAALMVLGAANMYNYVSLKRPRRRRRHDTVELLHADPRSQTNGEQKWKERVEGLATRTLELFFPEGIAMEPKCENKQVAVCNEDQGTFKGFTHRWLASSTIMAPFLKDKIMPTLKKSAQAAVDQCTGGDNGRMCGFHWVSGKYDGRQNAGEGMNVLSALTSLLVADAPAPVTHSSGGTSKGDANAGEKLKPAVDLPPITTADRAGAGILTALVLGVGIGTGVWLNLDL